MKKIIFIIILFSFIEYTGCATIFVGSNENIDLISEPSGAKIIINGNEEGTTPANIALKRGKEYNIEFSKNGYSKKSIRLSYSLNAGWLILDIVCGLIGVVVDGVTGNWNGFDTKSYKVSLETQK
jgi:hypothetical protein